MIEKFLVPIVRIRAAFFFILLSCLIYIEGMNLANFLLLYILIDDFKCNYKIIVKGEDNDV